MPHCGATVQKSALVLKLSGKNTFKLHLIFSQDTKAHPPPIHKKTKSKNLQK